MMKISILFTSCCLFPLICQAQTKDVGTFFPETYGGIYSTGDQVPGNPSNGVEVLQKVFSFIQIYRRNHQGSYSDEKGGVFFDVMKNKSIYGIDKKSNSSNPFYNPDGIYSDDLQTRKDPLHTANIAFFNKRPNGEDINGPKPNGVADVLAFSTTYYHENIPGGALGRNLFNPVGFYQVLYDDGQVAQVPYDEALFVCEADPQTATGIIITTVFPKQAGVPFNCFRNDEEWIIEYFGNEAQLGYRIPEGQKIPVPDNGGFEGIVRLSRLLGKPVDRPEVWKSFPPTETKFTLEEVASAASKVGMDLQRKAIGLDELAKIIANPTVRVRSV